MPTTATRELLSTLDDAAPSRAVDFCLVGVQEYNDGIEMLVFVLAAGIVTHCNDMCSYERASIVEWLEKHDTSPATGDCSCDGNCLALTHEASPYSKSLLFLLPNPFCFLHPA